MLTQLMSNIYYVIGSILVIILFLIILTCTIISAHVARKLVHPNRLLVDTSPEDYGLDYEAISFPSRDNREQLQGWSLPAKTEPAKMTIIFSHGYRGNRLETKLPALSLAKNLVASGFHVVMYDFRNCGQSSGNITSVGILEKQDILGAIDWVKNNTGNSIGLLGFSMGAATSLVTAAEAPEVLGVVADSPFSQLRQYMKDNLSVWSNLPRYPFTTLIMLCLRLIIRKNPNRVNPLLAVDHIYPRPILFIHGKQDHAIPNLHSVKMRNKHPDVFELWSMANVGHVETYAAHQDEYTRRVIDFFNHLI